jgi:hypothetical protein
MKRSINILFTLLILVLLLTLNVNAAESKMSKVSFDTVGYTPAGGSEVTLKDGQADLYLSENPQSFAEGEWETVFIRGWAGDTAEIETFGYKIDGGEFVAGEFKQATEAAVLAAGGEHASRFKVVVPVKTLKPGAHTATAYAKLKDGRILEVASFPFTVTGEEENPGTGSDAMVIVLFALVAISMTFVLTKKRAYN